VSAMATADFKQMRFSICSSSVIKPAAPSCARLQSQISRTFLRINHACCLN